MKGDIRLEATYPYTPEQVWKALTDPRALADWLMPNNFEARRGGKFQFRSDAASGFSGVIDCEVLELSPPRYLVFGWRSNQQDTIVSFTLEPAGQGTRLILEHTGFAPAEGTMASNILSSGWEKKIRSTLPRVLAIMTEGPAAGGAHTDASETAALISRYERGGAALEEALGALPVAAVNREPAPGTWNAQQIALHIVDAEIVGAGRLRMLAAQPGALLKSYKGDIWAEKLGYTRLSLQPALSLFRALRQTTAEMLHTLPSEAWMNRGFHEETGEITLENLLQAHCQHTEGHIEEIAALAGALARQT